MRALTIIAAFVAAVLISAGCSKPTLECQGNAVACGGRCADLKSDSLNCGTCGTPCSSGAACSAGVCAETLAAVGHGVRSCPQGEITCQFVCAYPSGVFASCP